MKNSTKAIRFLESLSIREGSKAGQATKLAPFQKQFVKGALADGINVACLSIGRATRKRPCLRASPLARSSGNGVVRPGAIKRTRIHPMPRDDLDQYEF